MPELTAGTRDLLPELTVRVGQRGAEALGKWCGAILRERRWRCVEEERGVRGGARAWRSAGKRGLVCVSVRASAEDRDRGRAVSECDYARCD